MSFESLLVHTGTLIRSVNGPSEFGTPGPPVPTTIATFPCRVSWASGSESPDRADMRPQRRTAKIFMSTLPLDAPARGDRVRVAEFDGPLFEIDFNRLVWDGAGPHHWELSVTQVAGD